MTVPATPAGRLLVFFDKLRSIKGEHSFRKLWAATLEHEIDSREEAQHFNELGLLLRRVQTTAQGLAGADLGHDEETLLFAYSDWTSAVHGWGLSLREDSNSRYQPRRVISDAARNALAQTHGIMHAAIREGVLKPSTRDEIITDVAEKISDLLAEVALDEDLPEYYRAQLGTRLTEIEEALINVRFRGDEAVGEAITRAALNFGAVANHSQDIPEEHKSDLQKRLESWSDTIKQVGDAFFSTFSVPAAAAYFLSTKDAWGTGLILATRSPEVVEHLPKALPTGSTNSGSTSEPKSG